MNQDLENCSPEFILLSIRNELVAQRAVIVYLIDAMEELGGRDRDEVARALDGLNVSWPSGAADEVANLHLSGIAETLRGMRPGGKPS